MAIPVNKFGLLTYATKPITSDIIDVYKKKLKNVKEYSSSSSAKPITNSEENSEIKEYLENATNTLKFGALTGINEDYYRPFERVANRLEYAHIEEDENQNEINLTTKDVSEELEEFNKFLEKAEAAYN